MAPPKPSENPAISSDSDDDDDGAGEVQMDAAQAERMMSLERELEGEAAPYDTHVEVRKFREKSMKSRRFLGRPNRAA